MEIAPGAIDVVVNHSMKCHRTGVEHSSARIGLERRRSLSSHVMESCCGGHTDGEGKNEQEVNISGKAGHAVGHQLGDHRCRPVDLTNGELQVRSHNR